MRPTKLHPTQLMKMLPVAALVVLAACADAGDRGLGPACEANLDAAERALSKAKGDSVGKVIDWTKAAGLIAAARTQQQFSEYQNCVLKAKQAREIIARRN
ncbi:MAG: hypothetical protein ACI9JL_004388 [Paracoccaceae bacterium]|jgi:hypothetical protein